MGRYVSHGHCLTSGQSRKLSCVRHAFSRSVGCESRLVRLFHGYLPLYPGLYQLNGLPWTFVVGVGLLKQVQHMFGAGSSPQRKQMMV
jgi:hypothetical protein